MSRILIAVFVCFLLLFSSSILPVVFAQPSLGRSGMPGFMDRRMAMSMRPPRMRTLNGIAYGNGIFVAIGPDMTILSSKDGKNWINCSSEIHNNTVNINFDSETYSANGDAVTFAILPKSIQLPALPSSSELQTNPEAFFKLSDILSKFQSQLPKVPFYLRSVIFGGGTFVIVGDGGEILISPDGEHWTTPASGTSATLTDVVWGNSGFIIIGEKGTILTSPNGSTWTRRNSGTEQTLFGVAFGNNRFVAVGDNNTIVTSSNGIEWQTTDIGPEAMESVAFGNGIFIGTSIDTDSPGKMRMDNHHTMTMASTDGKNWRGVNNPYPLQEMRVGVIMPGRESGGTTSLTFGGGLFIATSVHGIYTSKDGNDWNPSTEPDLPAGFKSCYYGTAFGNDIFIAVGNGQVFGVNQNQLGRISILSHSSIASSKDANSWSVGSGSGSSQTPPSRLLDGSLINEKTFMRDMSDMGGPAIILISNDGVTWATREKMEIPGTVYGNEVVFSSGSKPIVLSSKDGITWTQLKPSNTDNPTSVTAASNIQSSTISENGVSINLNGQSYKLNLTSDVGQTMEIQASTNLVDWTTLTTITNSGGFLNFTDSDATNYPMRFYRLKLQ